MIIGITGGTGCGKTTLLNILKDAGVLVLDCDAIYHELLQKDTALLSAIETRFPGTVENGQLQRKLLGSIVFSDKEALHDLNAITHGAIRTEVLRRLEAHSGHAAIDAVALIESGMSELCHVTVAVTAPSEVRVQRLMERERISAEYARARISSQPDGAWYSLHCDHTLENSGTMGEFQGKCLAFLQELGIMKI